MTDSNRPDWSGRLKRLRDDSLALDLDSTVVSSLPNIKYLCGFAGSAGLLVAGAPGATLILDGRYGLAAREAISRGEMGPVEVVVIDRRFDLTLASVLVRLEARRAGFEAEDVTVAILEAWQRAAPGIEWRSTKRLVESRRAIKDSSELRMIRRATQRLSDVARELASFVIAGRTEREVARAIDAGLERAGFSAPAFPTIVASGPHSAHPHARPTDRRLQTGDLVVLDFGGLLDGYCGDLTRMAAIGQVAPDARALFDAVREAQVAAIATVRAGIPASSVDAAARQTLDARGFGQAFLHATGHGLGLELHEAPRIGREDADRSETLAAGMVCTIEPGAYVDGLGGVRLEDDLLVTAEGCEVLTDAPRDLLVV